MRRIIVVCLLVPLALLVLAARGGSVPSQQDLLVNAARSLSGTKSAQLEAVVRVSATDKGKPAGGSASIRGGLSRQAVSLDGAVKFHSAAESQTFPFSLRVTPKQLYVKLMGDWYSSSLGDLKDQAKATADNATGAGKSQSLLEKLRTLMAAKEIAEHAFAGEVTHGPKLDGTDTWQWQGTVNPEGALDMAAKYGGDNTKLDPAERAKAKRALEQVAELTRITVIAGTDGKPRRVEVKIDATMAQLAKLAQATGSDPADMPEQLHASLRVGISRWNEPVTVTAPARAKPIEELFSGFFAP